MSNIAFSELPISPEILRGVGDMGFEEATPIQAQSIPHILEGRDLLGQAQTGTGKTCAFGIPIIDRVDPDDTHIQYLILSPTRELAMQIADELHEVTKYKEGIRILSVYGGQAIDRQILALKKRPQIIVGTPGRVMDHMRRKTIRLDHLRGIILDEADEMLNMGFKEDIDTILAATPERIQKVFFSATMPRPIAELTEKYLVDPVHVRITPKQLTVANIDQYYIEVREANKVEVLCRLIEAERIKLALVFCNMKRRVDELTEKLLTRGYAVEALHGDMKQIARTRVMNRFKKGEIDLLVATDVAARGIDVDDIEVVINYDLPQDEEYYVHRIGRTGRAGKSGKAYTFVVGREILDLKNIQHDTRSKIMRAQPPTLVDVTESRVGSILAQVQDQLDEGDLASYVAYVEKFVDGLNVTSPSDVFYTTADVAAAMLRRLMGEAFAAAEELEPVVPYQELIARRNEARRSEARRSEARRDDVRREDARRSVERRDAVRRNNAQQDTVLPNATGATGGAAVTVAPSAGFDDAYDEVADDDAYFGTTGNDEAGLFLTDANAWAEGEEPQPRFGPDADAQPARTQKSRGGKKLEPGMARLFINVGTDDKVQPKHLVSSICRHSDLRGFEIGAIAIYGRYSFVDVPEGSADQVVANLSHQKVGGRVVRVEKSDGPSVGPSGSASGGGARGGGWRSSGDRMASRSGERGDGRPSARSGERGDGRPSARAGGYGKTGSVRPATRTDGRGGTSYGARGRRDETGDGERSFSKMPGTYQKAGGFKRPKYLKKDKGNGSR